ncbi:hypothetical protein GCM10022384_20140 [Streptomyces marokkonensis]|uniref:Uncharacterized protein n=1 Tax=Streptomyces marokkonensis TaxID=324855 RepID=A0ABP7PNT1_9ACTN
MHTSTRSAPAAPAAATGLLAVVTALIALAISLVDDLGTPAYVVLVAADLLVVLVMGVLLAASLSGNAPTTADAARLERDLEKLDGLEPLRGDETKGARR